MSLLGLLKVGKLTYKKNDIRRDTLIRLANFPNDSSLCIIKCHGDSATVTMFATGKVTNER